MGSPPSHRPAIGARKGTPRPHKVGGQEYKLLSTDAPEEAMEYARAFEPPEIRESLKLEESEVVEARAGGPKGVYSTTGYHFFPGCQLDDQPPAREGR